MTPKKVAEKFSKSPKFKGTVSEKTIRRNMRADPGPRKQNEKFKYRARRVPKSTPLKKEDKLKRKAYAENGPITNGGQFGCVTLSEDWEYRKREIGWIDDKPWWMDSSSAKNRFYYDFADGSDPPETLAVDKHSPHFMNLCGISWNSRFTHFYSERVRNKRRSRNADGDLVKKISL